MSASVVFLVTTKTFNASRSFCFVPNPIETDGAQTLWFQLPLPHIAQVPSTSVPGFTPSSLKDLSRFVVPPTNSLKYSPGRICGSVDTAAATKASPTRLLRTEPWTIALFFKAHTSENGEPETTTGKA